MVEQPFPVVVRDISVSYNTGPGVSVQPGRGRFNTVHGNKGEGIMVDQPFPVVVRDNSVSYNTGLGVSVSSQGKVGSTQFMATKGRESW